MKWPNRAIDRILKRRNRYRTPTPELTRVFLLGKHVRADTITLD